MLSRPIRAQISLLLSICSMYACQPAPDDTLLPVAVVATNAVSTTMLPIANRQAVVDAYSREFAKTPLMNWTGNIDECREGSVAAAYVATQLSRINYYRAMAGIDGKVTFVDSLNRKAQKAVLMLSVAGVLTHKVVKSWKCYSEEANWATVNSNLAQTGGTSPDFITQYMADHGTNNLAVGHRRWILAPTVTAMGTGNILHPKTKTAYNALPVSTDAFSAQRQATRSQFVCWPVAGYIPYQLVFPRWSFQLPGADFSASSVEVKKGGSAVTATIVSDDNTDYGDNALVWEMDAVSKPTTDQVYEVTIQNVRDGGQMRSFSYKVTVIDPALK